MNKTQLKMAKAALGWSAKDLAAAAGLGYATIARFEAGQSVDDDSVAKMRKALADAGADFTRRAGRIGVTVPE
jgi:transcriptional regulator with XRE-family HTH domain